MTKLIFLPPNTTAYSNQRSKELSRPLSLITLDKHLQVLDTMACHLDMIFLQCRKKFVIENCIVKIKKNNPKTEETLEIITFTENMALVAKSI